MKKIYLETGLDTRINIKDVEVFEEYKHEHERITDLDLRPRVPSDTCQITTFNVNTGQILYCSIFSGTESNENCFHELMTQIEKLLSLYLEKSPDINNLCIRIITTSKFDVESYLRPKIALYDILYTYDEEILAHDIFFAPSIIYIDMGKVLLQNSGKFSRRYPRIYNLFYNLARKYNCRIDQVKNYLEGAFYESFVKSLEKYRYELESEQE